VIEYRICWAASSNAMFKDETDWASWGGDPDDAQEAVEEALNKSAGGLPQGLEEALEASGFEWWVETREAPDAS
jgi:hypothetical protein